jgi:hypothetical protein
MQESEPRELRTSVTDAIFEDTIRRLSEDASISKALIERLRTFLVERNDSSVDKLKQALLSEEANR